MLFDCCQRTLSGHGNCRSFQLWRCSRRFRGPFLRLCSWPFSFIFPCRGPVAMTPSDNRFVLLKTVPFVRTEPPTGSQMCEPNRINRTVGTECEPAGGNPANTYRTSLEHLSNISRTSIYRRSIEDLAKIYRTSIKTQKQFNTEPTGASTLC